MSLDEDLTGAVVVGIGARPGPDRATILVAVRTVVGEARIHCLATLDRRADEPGVIAAAAELGVPALGIAAAELTGVTVPNPAVGTMAAVGTASVAEAAAIVAGRRCGGAGVLTVPKTVIAGVTVAVAR